MNIKNISIIIILVLISQVSFANSPIKFDWGKSKAIVTETIDKNNSSVKIKYQIQVKAKKNDFLLKQSDIEVISMNGKKIEDSRMNKMFEGLVAFPKFKLDSNGEMVEIIDEDEFIENYGNAIPNPKLKEMLQVPSYREIVLMQSYQKWCYWVCLWTGEGLTVDNPIVTNEEIEFMGSKLPQRSVVKHHGTSAESLNNIKLTFLSVTGMDNSKEFVENAVKELNSVIKPDDTEIVPSSGSKVVNVEAIIDGKTLKPEKVVVDIKITMRSGDETKLKKEKHTFEFQWN